MKKIWFVLLIGLVLLSACSTKIDLAGTQWKLVSLDGDVALMDVEVTLNFDQESIGGNDGCNVYGGSYEAGETSIQFGEDLFSTQMYCTDEIMVQAGIYYDVLGRVTAYMADDQLLTFFNAEGNKIAEFIPLQD